MPDIYIWKITFGDNWDNIRIATLDDDIAGALGAAISYSKEHHDFTDEEPDTEPGMPVTEIEYLYQVMTVFDLTGSEQ